MITFLILARLATQAEVVDHLVRLVGGDELDLLVEVPKQQLVPRQALLARVHASTVTQPRFKRSSALAPTAEFSVRPLGNVAQLGDQSIGADRFVESLECLQEHLAECGNDD